MADESDILKNHVLWQKSWTDWSCEHGLPSIQGHKTYRTPVRTKPRRKTPETSRSTPSAPNTRRATSPSRPLAMLADRRDKRATRARPWTEDVPKIDSNKDTYVEIHYEKTLPKGKWMEYKQRQYVNNPKYGNIYEVRIDTSPPKVRPPSPSTWFWEEEYRIWRLEEPREGETPTTVSSSRLSYNTRNRTKKKTKDNPHADLFAQYHSYRLDKQRRNHAATNIQKMLKGWIVRHKFKKMKKQALVGLYRSWPKFTDEYKETVTRVQARHGVMRTHCQFDLDQVAEFQERRERYEKVFDRMVDRHIDKLPRDDLPEFFRACGLHPTEGEINSAFNVIFRGAGNTADIVFVLDCSASLGQVNFRCQLNFIKDIIQELDVAPDRIRVGFVPFNEDVFESFNLTRFKKKEDILEQIDKIKFKTGLTRTDLALKMMREMFQAARPGVQKICLVVTDGRSHDVNLTLREARKAQQDNIDIFMIGVGYDIDVAELKCIASSEQNVHTVSDYKALVELHNVIQKRICLGACTLCQHVLPRLLTEGFYRSEVMDILWTIFVPPGSGLTRNTDKLVDPYHGSDQSPPERSVTAVRDACRPLEKKEALEVVWSLYPPKASQVDARKSRWIRPVVGGAEAWSLLDDRILTETDFRTCLKLVIESRLRREGVIAIPSDCRAGIEEVSNAEEAIERIEKYLRERKIKEEKEKLREMKRMKKGEKTETVGKITSVAA